MFSLNFEGYNIFFNIRWKKRFKNVSTYHKKMRGIFKFFWGCSAWSLQQRSAKTTAKTPQRRHKDGPTNRKGPCELQRWTRPVWRYVVFILPNGKRPSLQLFLKAKPHIYGIFADLCKDLQSAKICKDAAKTPFWGRFGWKFSRILWGRGICCFEFYGGGVLQKQIKR